MTGTEKQELKEKRSNGNQPVRRRNHSILF